MGRKTVCYALHVWYPWRPDHERSREMGTLTVITSRDVNSVLLLYRQLLPTMDRQKLYFFGSPLLLKVPRAVKEWDTQARSAGRVMLHQHPQPVFSPNAYEALGITKRPVNSWLSMQEPPSSTGCMQGSAGLLYPTPHLAHSSWPHTGAYVDSHHDDHLISLVIKLAINKRADDCYIDWLWDLFFYLHYLSWGREGRRVG